LGRGGRRRNRDELRVEYCVQAFDLFFSWISVNART
jgi:hypothetical protein